MQSSIFPALPAWVTSALSHQSVHPLDVIPVWASRVLGYEFVPRTDRLADFGTSIQLAVVNHPTSSLGDQCCPTCELGCCSCWFRQNRVVGLPNRSSRAAICVSILQCCVPSPVLTSNMMYAPVSGSRSALKASDREIQSLFLASRLQMVTLSQPATHPFRRGYANTCQYVASTEAILVAELKSVMWLMFGRDPHRGPSTSLSAWPVDTLIQHSNRRGGSGAQEPRATMSYPSSNLHPIEHLSTQRSGSRSN